MGLESKTREVITEKFADNDLGKPAIWWEHGTLWADNPTLDEVELIKEGLLEVINSGLDVKVSKLKATETEPWDQYAFDIVGEVQI
jgi:hypothetical protein|tara:strand:+ start:510 stop:767 length:258 start_codon:yes stop_codon:yes gene_type:complete